MAQGQTSATSYRNTPQGTPGSSPKSSVFRRDPMIFAEKQQVSSQASAELASRLMQRLAKTEGGSNSGSFVEAGDQIHSAPVPHPHRRVGSPPTFKVAAGPGVPRVSLPSGRPPPMQDGGSTPKPFSARSGGVQVVPPPRMVSQVYTAQPQPQQQLQSTGRISAPPPTAGPRVQQGSRLFETAPAPKPTAFEQAEDSPMNWSSADYFMARELARDLPRDMSREEVCRELPADRIRVAQQQMRHSSSYTEADSTQRTRKMSSGRCYEELLELRSQNKALERQVQELELRSADAAGAAGPGPGEELLSLRRHVQVMQEQLTEQHTQRQNLESRLQAMQRQLSEQQQQRQNLESRLQASEAECSRLQYEGQQEYEASQAVEHDIRRKEERFLQLCSQKDALSRELQEVRRSHDIEKARTEEQLRCLHEKNAKSEAELEELRQWRVEGAQREEALHKENQELKLRLQEVTKALDASEQVLQQQLVAAKAKHQELFQQCALRNTETEKLRCQNDELRKELEELRASSSDTTEAPPPEAPDTVACVEDRSPVTTDDDAELRHAALGQEVEEIRRAYAEREAALQSTFEEQQLLHAQQEAEFRHRIEALQKDVSELEQINDALEKQVLAEQERCEGMESRPQQAAPSPCSEGRLRAAMTDSGVTTEELGSAIKAAEALIGEARREFERKQQRDRRAAFELLHNALEGNDEAALAQAIQAARKADVGSEDIQKGEARLEDLRSRSVEERAALLAREVITERKKQAFLSIKKADLGTLQDVIENLDDIRWQDWRQGGRTLWQYAQDVRNIGAQEFLAPLLGYQSPVRQKFDVQIPTIMSDSSIRADAERTPELVAAPAPVVPAEVEPPPPPVEWNVSEAEQAEVRTQAFRCVASNSTVELQAILERVPKEIWSLWQNKGGKDLLGLSLERGEKCADAYSILAKALGLVQELKRETFEEREAVWIFVEGAVQPLRATVLEDTPAESDTVYIEYWDGDEPPSRVDRCLVRKGG